MDRDRDRGGNWHHERGGGDWGGGTRPNDRGGGTRPNDRGGGARPNEAHMGPLRLPGGQGTLTARDRDDIWERYRVSASVRWRAQWAERCLSLSGDAGSLNAAKDMGMERIAQHGTEGGRASEPTAGPQLQALQTQVHQLDQYVRNHHSLLQHLTQQATRAEQTAGQAVAAAQAYRQAGQDSLERISQRNTEAREEFEAGIEERVQQIVRQVLEDRKKKRRKKRRTKRSESAEDEKEAEREKQDEQKQDGEGSPLHDTSFAKAERMSSTSPAGRDDLVAAVGEPAGFPEAIAAEQKMAQQGEEEEEDTSEQSPEVFAAPAHDYMEPIEEPETPCLTVDDMTETMRLSANVKELPHDDDAKEEQPGSG